MIAGILIALLSGALMSLQGIFNTGVTKQTGLWLAAGFVQLTAFLTCALIWFFSERTAPTLLLSVRPWYLLAGGVLGAMITCTVVKGMGMLGPAGATLLIVTAQIAVSYIVELFGWFGVEKSPFEWKKLVGILIAAAGILVFGK